VIWFVAHEHSRYDVSEWQTTFRGSREPKLSLISSPEVFEYAANYRAAQRARSKAEFKAKLQIALEEADECHFLDWISD